MAKLKVTWKTMEDSAFIPARTFDIPMPRPRKSGAETIPSMTAVAEEPLLSAH